MKPTPKSTTNNTKTNPQSKPVHQPRPNIQQPRPKPTNQTVLRRDPIKSNLNKEAQVKLANQIMHVAKQHSEESKVKHEKKPKKKWYDKVLDMTESLGKHLLPYLPMLLGMGDYSTDEMPLATGTTPKTNSILAHLSKGKIGNDVPYVHATGESVRIPHREYIGDVYSSDEAFVTERFSLNPGLESTFKWLAPIANQFTSYRFGGAVIEFISQGSEYANAAGLGYVGVGVQYNASEPEFANKDEMMNSQFSNMDKPSKSFTTWVECDPAILPESRLYVRSGDVPAGSDIKFYDHGVVTLAVGGNTEADAILGSLYISYDIELFLPRPKTGSTIGYTYYVCAGVTTSDELGTVYTKQPGSNITLIVGTSSVQFPRNFTGYYDFEINFLSAGPKNPLTLPTITASGIEFFTHPFASVGESTTGGLSSSIRRYMHFNGEAYPSISVSASGAVTTGIAGIILYEMPSTAFITASKILDSQGANKEIRYSNFMKKFKQQPQPQWKTELLTRSFAIQSYVAYDCILYRAKHYPVDKDEPLLDDMPLPEKVYQATTLQKDPEEYIFKLYKTLRHSLY